MFHLERRNRGTHLKAFDSRRSQHETPRKVREWSKPRAAWITKGQGVPASQSSNLHQPLGTVL